MWKGQRAGKTELEGTMAAISGSRDQHVRTTERLVSALQTQGRPVALTAGIIVAVTGVLGGLWVGAVIAGLFVAGNAIVAIEGRTLQVDEFAAISTLHAAAAAVLALSL